MWTILYDLIQFYDGSFRNPVIDGEESVQFLDVYITGGKPNVVHLMDDKGLELIHHNVIESILLDADRINAFLRQLITFTKALK